MKAKSIGAQQLSLSPKGRRESALVLVDCSFNELACQAREVEEQTEVTYMHRRMPLHEALRSVMETCFSLWMQVDEGNRDSQIREIEKIKNRLADEGSELVKSAFRNPMQARAVARVVQLGFNFLRTLDMVMEAIFRYPSQKSLSEKPKTAEAEIDWAVGGLCVWNRHYQYDFEGATGYKLLGGRPLKHFARPLATERSQRAQITHKIIANMFWIDESDVSDIERAALGRLREAFAGKEIVSVEGLGVA